MKLSIPFIAFLIAGAATVCLMAYVFEGARPVQAATLTANTISTATTSAATSITTSARVLATTTNPIDPANSYIRMYASICNPSATPVALNLNGDKAANGTTGAVTTFIAAAAGYNTCFEITDRNQYSGSVTASSTTGAAVVVTSQQFVQ